MISGIFWASWPDGLIVGANRECKTQERRSGCFQPIPRGGSGKTRLIKAPGPEGAADMHRCMSVFTVGQAQKAGGPVQARNSGGRVGQMRAWLGRIMTMWIRGSVLNGPLMNTLIGEPGLSW